MRAWVSMGLVLLLASILFISFPAALTTRAEEPVRVTLDGRELSFDVPPQIINGRTMVPFRAIFEALGATVDYDPETRSVYAVRGNDTVQLTIDSNVVEWRRSILKIDAAPTIVGGRTLVPLRFIGMALGINVQWDGESRTVLLETEPEDADLARGIQIVHTKGCMVCHTIHGVGGNIAPELNGVTDRYSEEWLRTWLRNPQAVRPGSRMPKFGFSEDEITAVIRFLETLK